MGGGLANGAFECAVCSQPHAGLPALTFNAPLPYLADADDAQARAGYRLSSDTCSWKEQDFFLRGVLVIPIRDADFDLEFGVWASVSPENFRAYEAAKDDTVLPAMFGWFASRIPGYPDTLLLKVMTHPQPDGLRPLFELEPTDHPLAQQQRDGISLNDAIAYFHQQFPDGW